MIGMQRDIQAGTLSANHVLCHSVNRVTEEMLGVVQEPVLRRGDGRRQRCQIRQISMYLCHVVLGLPQQEVATAFGYDRSTVSYACQVIEDRRDNKALDQFISVLERLVAVLATVSKAVPHG
jgi:chromosomal replication initiation ATPase DnaA